VSPAPQWGLFPLDWHAHAIDEHANHPYGVYVSQLRVLTDDGHHAAREPTEPICLPCARWADW
jgi:hypothetical protein